MVSLGRYKLSSASRRKNPRALAALLGSNSSDHKNLLERLTDDVGHPSVFPRVPNDQE